jgi:hypothetical protein
MEWRVPFSELRDPQTMTQKNIAMMRARGLDIHRHEIDLIDDHDRQERVYRVKLRSYFQT